MDGHVPGPTSRSQSQLSAMRCDNGGSVQSRLGTISTLHSFLCIFEKEVTKPLSRVMLSVAALSQPCSSRFAAALASALRPAFRPFSSSRQVGQEKAAQPQTPATEHIELSAVSGSLRSLCSNLCRVAEPPSRLTSLYSPRHISRNRMIRGSTSLTRTGMSPVHDDDDGHDEPRDGCLASARE